MNFGVGIANALTRLNSINEIFGSLPLHALNNPYVLKHMSQTNVNNLKQWIYNQSFIFRALEKSLFGPSGLTKQSGKVHFQKQTGGNPYQTMFQIFFILLALTATLIESSNEMVVNSQKSEPAFEWRTNLVVETKVVNVINVPGTITPMFGALTYKWPLNTAINKLFQETQRDVSKLLKEIRGKCLSHGKQSKAYMHLEYINTDDGSQVIDSITQNPTTYDKDTQMAACFEINPLPFNFNQETGSIEFIHVNMPINQIIDILNTILSDMDSVIKDTSKPKPNKEFTQAYNGILIIADGLEKIRDLLFDVFSPVVFNPDMPNEYRLENLNDSFNSIINEMIRMKDLLNLKNPHEQMEASSKLAYAKEEFENAEIIASARKKSREARQIESNQNVKDTKAYYANVIDENMAASQSIGKKILEVPANIVGAVSDSAINTALAPVNSLFKGAREMIMNNKLIALLFALGVFVTGVVTIKVRKGIISIVYKIANAIKTIVLVPITIPYSIGTKIINVLCYKTVEETNSNALQIDNGPVVVTPVVENQVAVVAPAEPVVTQVVAQVKQKPTKKQDEIEVQKLETELARILQVFSDFERNGIKDKLPGIRRRIVQLTETLDRLKNASGTRKRNNKKNTKKKNLKKRTKPSRKFR